MKGNKIPLNYPPGIVRTGTDYSAKGRWIDGNLVRWREGVVQAVGGWTLLPESDDSQVDAGNPVRGMHAFVSNAGVATLVFGTYLKLYIYQQGVVTDITPGSLSTLTTADQEGDIARLLSGAFGDGAFGAGPFGVGSELTTLQEAAVWQLDNYGEDIVALLYGDGSIWYHDLSAGTTAALSNAPVDCAGVVVTPERFIVALGPADDPRAIQWADQDDATIWTAAAENQAGGVNLASGGAILAGRRTVDETLIWTTTDLYSMRYVGGTFIYNVVQVAAACGAASRQSMAVVGSRAFWMGKNSFYHYAGQVEPLDCPVADFIFNDLNETQRSQIWAEVRSDFHEITWHYPSAGSNTCDRYVTFNYKEGWWSIGFGMRRTAGVDAGIFAYPILSDDAGLLYRHEVGSSKLDPDSVALVPYLEGAPFEIATGDRVMDLLQFIPDEMELGEVQISFFTKFFPTGDETETQVSSREPTDLRLTARQARLRIEEVTPGWRWGVPRIEAHPGSRR